MKEEHIARELGLSRTPVRAALKRLIDDQLATLEPRRGVRVAQWTDADIIETYHLRSLLEAHAAERAAQRQDPSTAAALEQLNSEMAQAISSGGANMALRLQAINSRFHRTILEASGSPRLKMLMASIIDMPIVVRSFFVSTRADIEQSLQHHRDIADAIASGDGELAAQAMQLHLRIAGRRFFQRRAEFAKSPTAARAQTSSNKQLSRRSRFITHDNPEFSGQHGTEHAWQRAAASRRCSAAGAALDCAHPVAWTISKWRRASHLPRPIFGYIAGAAEDNHSQRGNRAAFDEFDFVPRVLVDVSRRSTATDAVRARPMRRPSASRPWA